jgi:hypothetical protein
VSVPASQLPPPGFPWAGRQRLPSSGDTSPATHSAAANSGRPTASSAPADACPLRLPAEDVSVPRARHTVDAWLRRHGVGSEIRDQVALVLSELTANAVTHTDSDWIVCGAALSPMGAAVGTVQVEVHDEDRAPGTAGASGVSAAADEFGAAGPYDRVGGAQGRAGSSPGVAAPRLEQENGRGLHIVEALAARWGVTASPFTRGKAVWALLQP